MDHGTIMQKAFEDFSKELYDSDLQDTLPSKKHFKKFVTNFVKSLPEIQPNRKSSGGRVSTLPGAVFNEDLCRCRIWNKGDAKQCSSKKANDEYCKMHYTKINGDEDSDGYGGWSYGYYNEAKPDNQLFDGAGKTFTPILL